VESISRSELRKQPTTSTIPRTLLLRERGPSDPAHNKGESND
jgi:hypothetical protein